VQFPPEPWISFSLLVLGWWPLIASNGNSISRKCMINTLQVIHITTLHQNNLPWGFLLGQSNHVQGIIFCKDTSKE
jgi:hypothetical protein